MVQKALLAAAALVLATPVTGRAALVAGWDFSQWAGESFLVIDLALIPQNTLPANYSDFDATFGAGPDSAAFGTLYFNGSFGSSTVDPNAPVPAFNPFSFQPTGSLQSNLDAPTVAAGFDTFDTLLAQGQVFTNAFVMQALQAISVVFEAVPQSADELSLTLAGVSPFRNLTVAVEADLGSGFAPVGSIQLTAGEERFVVPLGAPTLGENVLVRLALPDGAVIDNVAIETEVPEPASGPVAAAAALAGLGALRRRRA